MGEAADTEKAGDPKVRRFDSAGSASKELYEQWNACSGFLTNRSVELSFGILAANWAVYKEPLLLLSNPLAGFSVGVVVLFLALNLVLTWLMAAQYGTRVDYADEDRARWENEFKAAAEKGSPWPYTTGIETLGRLALWMKVGLPVLAGASFILSMFLA